MTEAIFNYKTAYEQVGIGIAF